MAAVAAVVAIAFGNTVWQTRAIDREIALVRENLARTNEVIGRADSTLAVSRVIDEWDTRDVDFLYQLTELNRILPGTDRVYLENLRFNPVSGAAVAQIQADGRARSREDVEQLEQRLREHEYSVRPHEKTSSDKDKEYPVGFVLDLGITPATNSRVEWPPVPVDDADQQTTDAPSPAATPSDPSPKAGDQ